VSLMFTHDFPFLLEIRVYRQTIPPKSKRKVWKY
jgi:hypothetical protein